MVCSHSVVLRVWRWDGDKRNTVRVVFQNDHSGHSVDSEECMGTLDGARLGTRGPVKRLML